jgi:3-oxoacyl-[acyl-carrier-protein] synthase II
MRSDRVFITGMGVMTSLGENLSATRQGILEGREGIAPLELFDAARYRCKVAGQIRGLAPMPGSSRASRLLIESVCESLKQAGWTREHVVQAPVSMGTTNGGMFEGERFFRELHSPEPDQLRSREASLAYPVSRQLQDLEQALQIQGPKRVFSNACASGANGIGHAFQMIRSGIWSHAFAGGYDALCELSFAGFDCLRSLAPMYCQPFARNRKGLLLGEGSGVLAMESEAFLKARGGVPIVEVLGYGATTDTYHHTQHNPDGGMAARSMELAMRQGGIAPEQIAYINAHGTGTVLNDSMEAAAIRLAFGSACSQVCVSSNKAAIGHLLGGAGSVEAILTAISLSEGWVPPTLHLDEVDPICAFRVVSKTEEVSGMKFALTNSFGFGGACASLLIGKV